MMGRFFVAAFKQRRDTKERTKHALKAKAPSHCNIATFAPRLKHMK